MNNIKLLVDAEFVKVENPWLFFIALGLIIVVLVGFFLLPVEKRKKPKNIISVVLHVVISITLATAFSNISFLNTSKNVEVVVLADCSASESQSVSTMTTLINDVYSQAKNSKIGVVAYGRNQKIVNPIGSSFDSKKLENMFDDEKNGDFDYTASDMASALNYANTLFSNDCIKRIILISDGIETDNSAIEVIDSLVSSQVSIDTIKLNENFKDEFGITGIDYVVSSFVGRQQEVKISLRSIRSEKVRMKVTSEGKKLDERDIELTSGLNVYTFKYTPTVAETREFEISFEERGDGKDTYTENNSIHYSQTYVDKMNVLFIGEGNGDHYFFESLNMYKNDPENQNSKIDEFVQTDSKCPYKLEDLLKYDEIVLSDVDIKKMAHGQQFTTSLNTAVYTHGKSLLTFGSTNSANPDDSSSYLTQYNGMLPVQFDSADQKALIFLIDNSGSMGTDQMNTAKNGTIKCLDLLNDNDYVGVVTFESDTKIVQPLTAVSNKDTITKNVRKIQSAGGTMMAAGLDQCRKMLADTSIEYKYVLCLSDGLPSDESASLTAVKKLASNNIMVNFINIANSSGETFLKNMAKRGNGKYKYVSSVNKLTSAMENLVVGEVEEDEIDQDDTPVEVKSEYNDDAILTGTGNSFPSINGFNYCRIKSTSKTVLTVTYNKADEDNSGAYTYIIVPLFAYWDYGNGKVSSFTSSIKNQDWTKNFFDNNSVATLMKNIATQTLPYESSEHILTLDYENKGISSSIAVSPNNGDIQGKITATITKPDKSTDEVNLIYDGENYSIDYPISQTGTYTLNIKYTGSVNGEAASDEITRNLYFDFSKEFDFFTNNNTELLDKIAKRANGQYTIEKVNYQLNAEELANSNYFSTMMIFLLISVILFLVDVFVRKSDGLFKKKKVDTNSAISE